MADEKNDIVVPIEFMADYELEFTPEELEKLETRLNELAQTACLMRDKEYYCGEATEENKELETNE